jgi:hypothetical protein
MRFTRIRPQSMRTPKFLKDCSPSYDCAACNSVPSFLSAYAALALICDIYIVDLQLVLTPYRQVSLPSAKDISLAEHRVRFLWSHTLSVSLCDINSSTGSSWRDAAVLPRAFKIVGPCLQVN